MLRKYSRVSLVTNKYKMDGLGIGSVGYIIESYENDKYEVEFSNEWGVSIAQVVVCGEDVILIPESNDKK